MANGAVAVSQAPAMGATSAGNPFQVATNLYAEKNRQPAFSGLIAPGQQPFGFAVNAGNFMRSVRMLIRTTTPGVAGTALGADGVFNILTNLSMSNVDGSEILYAMNGWTHSQASKYFRPWDNDPFTAYDYSTAVNSPAGTLVLKPEIRWTAGCLANTDSRSQYNVQGYINTLAAVGAGYTTAPTISVTPYLDAYAQPDPTDLQGVPNQVIPPGVNLQYKRRHQLNTGLSGAGGNNIIPMAMTGNALRGVFLVFRDSTGARQDGLSDPVSWRIDNRNLGKFSPDIIFQWMQDHYSDWAQSPRATGVYVFPRFLLPGQLTGTGWLYTSNATQMIWEFATAAGIVGSPSVETVTDEVYPVGPVDPTLVDI